MSINDLKLYALNSIAMALSFTEIEQVFKLVLLSVSIVYTVMKIIELSKNKKNGSNNSE